ncbi:MAG: DUF4838 domain-containing protein, partial [Clostridia bacterium]|nr:DUF4838 domain-containing protein [Clostridia bacterium]
QHNDWYAYNPSYNRVNSKGYSHEEVCYSNGLDDDGNYIPQPDGLAEEQKTLPTKIIEICKKMILDEKNTGATVIMLGHGDYAAKCECARCKKYYEKFGGFSGATCVWMNEIVKEVKKWVVEQDIPLIHDLKFSMFGYSKSIEAPVVKQGDKWVACNEKVILDKDIYVQMAYRVCNYHSVMDENCEENELARERFDKWAAIANGFEIWDYTSVFTNYLWYLPNLATVSDNYKMYESLNVERVLSQGAPGLGNYYGHLMVQWLHTKLMWNPYRNVNELIADFNRKYFGEKYAKYVDDYLAMMENHYAILDATKKGGFHAATYDNFGFFEPENTPYELLQGATNLLQKGIDEALADESLTAEERERISYRLRQVIVTPQFMTLYLGYIIDEQRLKEFAGNFFENVDILELGQMYEGDRAGFQEWKKSFDLD